MRIDELLEDTFRIVSEFVTHSVETQLNYKMIRSLKFSDLHLFALFWGGAEGSKYD